MRIKALHRFDPRATYDVTVNGERIGQIQKVFGASLLRSTYRLYDVNGKQDVIVEERSLPVAIVRRILHLVPFVEDIASWLPIPYDFVFKRGEVLSATIAAGDGNSSTSTTSTCRSIRTAHWTAGWRWRFQLEWMHCRRAKRMRGFERRWT